MELELRLAPVSADGLVRMSVVISSFCRYGARPALAASIHAPLRCLTGSLSDCVSVSFVCISPCSQSIFPPLLLCLRKRKKKKLEQCFQIFTRSECDAGTGAFQVTSLRCHEGPPLCRPVCIEVGGGRDAAALQRPYSKLISRR